MAHFEKYKASDVHWVVGEHERDPEVMAKRWALEPGEYGYIDRAREGENYVIGTIDHEERIQGYIARHGALGRAFRSDGVAMGEWVVTLPQDWPRERDPRELWEVVLAFMRQRYGGEGNVPGLWVHLDEGRPHAHIPVIPRAEDERLRAKDMFTRKDLRSFHDDLESYCCEALGMESVGLRLNDEERQERTARYVDTKTYAQAQRALEAAAERSQKAAEEAEALETRLESLRRSQAASERGLRAQIGEVVGAAASARDAAAEVRELERRAQQAESEVASLRRRVASAERDLGRLRGIVRAAADACTHSLQQLAELPLRMSREFAESRVGRAVLDLLRRAGRCDVEIGGRYDLERRELTALDRVRIASQRQQGQRERACTHSRDSRGASQAR